MIIFGSLSIVGVNYGLADFRSGNKVKQKPTFSKVVGVGNAHKYFKLSEIFDSQTACRLAD